MNAHLTPIDMMDTLVPRHDPSATAVRSDRSLLRIALVADQPSPYRVPIYQAIAAMPDVHLHVLFCCRREPNRLWGIPPLDFEHTYLRERFTSFKGRQFHNNPDVIAWLNRIAPEVIVTNGFSPTHLYALAYAQIRKLAHVAMSGDSEHAYPAPTALQKTLRRLVYARTHAFLYAHDGDRKLFEHCGVEPDRSFSASLCVDNETFSKKSPAAPKQFDLLFSGRLETAKNPHFALDVALDVAQRLHRKVSILFVGAGSQETQLKKLAAVHADMIETRFFGLAAQSEMPSLYRAARIFLFPASRDPWGVAAQEACAAGLPVVVTPAAGVAGEVVRDGENGFVCELNISLWGERAAMLLTQTEVYQRFSERSQAVAYNYTVDRAATGFANACRKALASRGKKKEISENPPRPRVVIVERQLLHYRVALYERLRTLLTAAGVDLQLLIGEGTPEEIKKQNQTSLDWSISIPTRYLLQEKLCWQPFGSYARNADLVIVMHENKLVYNLWLLSFGRPRRLAFWGHGRNMQSDQPNGLKERFKRWTVNKVDWWFAYTESSAALVHGAGFPHNCTTVVENAVDTDQMREFCKEVSEPDRQAMRDKLGMGNGPIGLYLGSLYHEKRLDFLLDAARRIREKMPEFQLLVVGAGPGQSFIEEAARENPWIHYLGPLQDREKARALMLADVMLNPGLVGLGVLDSFVCGRPMFTTDCGLHSPEISYLLSGHNGVMTPDDVDIYADTIVSTLSDPAALGRLQEGALASASRYTVDNMAQRLCNGILACIARR